MILPLPDSITEVAVVSLVLLPAAGVFSLALVHHRRRRGVPAAAARCTGIADVLMAYGTLPWVYMTMLPGRSAGAAAPRTSLVPLRDLFSVLTGHPLTALVQVVGNLCVFAALGFFVPIRFRALASTGRIIALASAGSVTIEVTQYAFRLDRVSSVDDVLLNAAGAALAAIASRRWWSRERSEERAAEKGR